jgi:hypothetical protein
MHEEIKRHLKGIKMHEQEEKDAKEGGVRNKQGGAGTEQKKRTEIGSRAKAQGPVEHWA